MGVQDAVDISGHFQAGWGVWVQQGDPHWLVPLWAYAQPDACAGGGMMSLVRKHCFGIRIPIHDIIRNMVSICSINPNFNSTMLPGIYFHRFHSTIVWVAIYSVWLWFSACNSQEPYSILYSIIIYNILLGLEIWLSDYYRVTIYKYW